MDEREFLRRRIYALEQENKDLRETFDSLVYFHKRLEIISTARSKEEILNATSKSLSFILPFRRLEIILLEGEDFIKFGTKEKFTDFDTDLIRWTLENENITFIPDENVQGHAYILCPLTGRTTDIGVIFLEVKLKEKDFTEQMRTFLRIFSIELSSVIENIRLRETIQNNMIRLRNIIESVPDAIFTLNLDNTISMLNTVTEFMFNTSQIEALEENYNNVFPPHICEIIRQLINNLEEEKGDNELQTYLKIGNGTQIDIVISISELQNSQKERTGYLFICRDISLSREVEKLRELDKMKDEFISLVSHELRTPLSVIMTYTESLLMDGMVESEEERKEFLQTIYNEGERLTRLINDVLDLTKMESGKLEYIFKEEDINEVVKDACNSIRPVVEKKGLFLKEEYTPNLPKVMIDKDRIKQVLMNILSNAVKFTEKGGITVKTELQTLNNRKKIKVSIKDTGCGIAPENYSKIFNKFEQIEEMKHHSIGTGLGMPISKQIIEEGHGGEIWFESEVGKGTTFYFTLNV